MSLDGISMHPLSIELDRVIAGGRIDKITQPNKQSIVLSVRQPGRNHLVMLSINPQNPAVHIIDKAPDNPSEPPMFCMVLRKHIETGRIASVRQYSLDRLIIIDIDFLSSGGQIITKSLMIELMGKYSNIILVQDGQIIDSLRKVGTNSSRIRTILPGDEYRLPPQQDKLNLLELPLDDIICSLRNQPEEKLSKGLLNTCLGFGPVTAKETAFLSGLPANIKIQELDEADFASIREALKHIVKNVREPADTSAIALDKNGKLLATASFPLHYPSTGDTSVSILSFDTISAMLSKASALSGGYQLPDRDRFQRLVKNELSKAENKIKKLDEEISASDNAEEFRIKADNLMTYQYSLKDHADASITVTDIYSETGESIEIKLDQRLTISQNVQSLYKKYDKLKRGKEIILQQQAQCRDDINYLSTMEVSLATSTKLAEINDIKAELIATGYLKEKPKKKAAEKPSQPFRFTLPDGTEVLVGKNNYQNDKLTFKLSNPYDIWMHTKDIPGSHVILRTEGNEPSEDNLLLAAQLAVHFSKASEGSKVPVDYTRCRFVKKPSGAKPGFVIFTNQSTLYISPDMEELQPILNQEI